jgi:hypothetical protein
MLTCAKPRNFGVHVDPDPRAILQWPWAWWPHSFLLVATREKFSNNILYVCLDRLRPAKIAASKLTCVIVRATHYGVYST